MLFCEARNVYCIVFCVVCVCICQSSYEISTEFCVEILTIQLQSRRQ